MVYLADLVLYWPVGPHQLSNKKKLYKNVLLFFLFSISFICCYLQIFVFVVQRLISGMVQVVGCCHHKQISGIWLGWHFAIGAFLQWRLPSVSKHSGTKCFRELELGPSQSFVYCCIASVHFVLSLTSQGNLCKLYPSPHSGWQSATTQWLGMIEAVSCRS